MQVGDRPWRALAYNRGLEPGDMSPQIGPWTKLVALPWSASQGFEAESLETSNESDKI